MFISEGSDFFPSFDHVHRSSVINLIIFFQIFFSLRSYYFAKIAISCTEGFQLNAVCIQKLLFDSFCAVT